MTFTEHTKWKNETAEDKVGCGADHKKVKSKHAVDENTIHLHCGYDIIYIKIRGIFGLSQTHHFQCIVVLTVWEVTGYPFTVSWLGVLH